MPLEIVTKVKEHFYCSTECAQRRLSNLWWKIYTTPEDELSECWVSDSLEDLGLTAEDYNDFMSSGPGFTTLTQRR